MCANYTPVTREERLRAWFAAGHPAPALVHYPEETWPGYPAPFVRQSRDATAPGRELAVGLFGLIPHWSKDLTIGRKTYNARSETVAEKPSFRDAWRLGRRCIIPAESFFEPQWESGRAVRWRIRRKDSASMGIAGLWSHWTGPDGGELLSFTMLTINAADHAVMRHFHKPEDEKRMVVILAEADYDRWLQAPTAQMSDFLTRYPAEALEGEPAPRPPARRSKTPADPTTPSLI
jgi:putative SOS response-associated peptidase YedK